MGNNKKENFLKGNDMRELCKKRDKSSQGLLKKCIYHVGEGNEIKVVKRNFKEKNQ